MQWFRLYHEWAHDPKIQMLDHTTQRHFIMLCCMHSEGLVSETTSNAEVAFYLRVSETEAETLHETFRMKNFVNSTWELRAWAERQKEHDLSTNRVRKHRENKKKLNETETKRFNETSETLSTEQNRTDKNRTESPPSPPAGGKSNPVDWMADDWNDLAVSRGLPKVSRLTDNRRRTMRKRLVEDFGGDRPKFRAFVQRVAASPMLTGGNDRGWRADFDWCLKPANLTKILEGNYDPRRTNGHSHRPSNPKSNAVDDPYGDQAGFEAALAAAEATR